MPNYVVSNHIFMLRPAMIDQFEGWHDDSKVHLCSRVVDTFIRILSDYFLRLTVAEIRPLGVSIGMNTSAWDGVVLSRPIYFMSTAI